MGLISITLPTIGDPNSTEDVDIRNGLATIQTVINGNLDNANIAAGAAIAGTKLAAASIASDRIIAGTIAADRLAFIPLTAPGGALACRVGSGSLTIGAGNSTGNVSVTHNLGVTPIFAAAVPTVADTGTYHGTGMAITARAANTMTVEGHNYEAYSGGVVLPFLWVVIG